jgi:DNA-binding YbaB/EbfC family protein
VSTRKVANGEPANRELRTANCESRIANRDEDHIVNIQQMMKQAQQMQDKLQKQMAEMRIEATSGGGMVTVVVNGAKQVLSLKIDPEAVSKEDVEMLQDLILAAINDGHRKADEAMQKQMGGMMGGLKIPGLF